MDVSSLKRKVPPHNTEAETAVLGALLLDPDAVGVVSHFLSAASFYSPANQKIYQTILDRSSQGKNSDILLLTEDLRSSGDLNVVGGPGYVASLTDSVPSSANVEYYARIVQDLAVRRSLLKAAHKMSADAFNDTETGRSILESAQKDIFELTDAGNFATFRSAKEIVPDVIELIEKLHGQTDDFTGIPSGFSRLDMYTNGFQNSEFIIIGARPSMGKTALALSMAEHIAIHKRIPVGFFSLEMPGTHLVQRLLSSISHVSSTKMRSGKVTISDFEQIRDAASKIYEAPLYIADMPNMRLLDLRTMARQLRSRYNIEIIFIDYLSLISSENQLLPRHEQIAGISRSLKSLARELNIPVVALSQVGRPAEGRAPSLSDIRESGSLEQDADVVMFLHRERLSAHDESQGKGRDFVIDTDLILAKQRNGPIGTVHLVFHPQYTTFHSKEPER